MQQIGFATMPKLRPDAPGLVPTPDEGERDASASAPDESKDDLDAALQRTFGANLRARRKALGMTQAEVAAAAEMHRPDVTAIEAGSVNVTLGTMRRLATAVHCQVEVLLKPLGDS